MNRHLSARRHQIVKNCDTLRAGNEIGVSDQEVFLHPGQILHHPVKDFVADAVRMGSIRDDFAAAEVEKGCEGIEFRFPASRHQ